MGAAQKGPSAFLRAFHNICSAHTRHTAPTLHTAARRAAPFRPSGAGRHARQPAQHSRHAPDSRGALPQAREEGRRRLPPVTACRRRAAAAACYHLLTASAPTPLHPTSLQAVGRAATAMTECGAAVLNADQDQAVEVRRERAAVLGLPATVAAAPPGTSTTGAASTWEDGHHSTSTHLTLVSPHSTAG